jgi:hypothetical protein
MAPDQSNLCHTLEKQGETGSRFIGHPKGSIDVNRADALTRTILHGKN